MATTNALKIKVRVMLQPAVSQPVRLMASPTLVPRPDYYYCQSVASLLMYGALSDEMGLSFTIVDGPCQYSHSLVHVPQGS
jgi:hypothetical protein